MLTTKFSFGEQ